MADSTAAVSTGILTPEIWSAKININLDNYGAYNDIVNRKYEGEIKKAGDVVKFYTYGALKVGDYTGADVTIEDPKATLMEMPVDQKKYIAFQVDDVDEAQSNVKVVDGFTNRMAVAFANTKDLYIHGLAVAGAKTKMNSASALLITKDNVWAEICKMYATLKRENAIVNGVDYAGKRPALVVTPEFEAVLNQCPNFFANAFGAEVLKKGQVGYIGGFDVYTDTNLPAGEGEIVAMTSDAITFAEQVTETKIGEAEKSFKSIVKSLHVYGGKVANAGAIVTNKIKFA